MVGSQKKVGGNVSRLGKIVQNSGTRLRVSRIGCRGNIGIKRLGGLEKRLGGLEKRMGGKRAEGG